MEIGEPVSIPGPSSNSDDKTKMFNCDWKNCRGKHEKKPSYRGGGSVDRNSTYESDWVSAGLEPWVLRGNGINSLATIDDYRAETPKAKYAVAAAVMQHPMYHTQKHHLVSVNLFRDVPRLAHNAKLLGYDVNAKNRGSHPNELYNNRIRPLLRDLESLCLTYCNGDSSGEVTTQTVLLRELEKIARRTESRIIHWVWLLRSDASAERSASKEQHEMRLMKSKVLT